MAKPRLRQRPQVRRRHGVRLGEGEVLAPHAPGRGRVHRREAAHVQLVDGVVRGLRALHAGAFHRSVSSQPAGFSAGEFTSAMCERPSAESEREYGSVATARTKDRWRARLPTGDTRPLRTGSTCPPDDRADDGPHAVGALGHLGVERGVVAARAVEQPEAHAARGGRPHANSHRRRVAVDFFAAETGESAARSAFDRDTERVSVAAEDVMPWFCTLVASRRRPCEPSAFMSLHCTASCSPARERTLAHKRLRDARQRVPWRRARRVPVARPPASGEAQPIGSISSGMYCKSLCSRSHTMPPEPWSVTARPWSPEATSHRRRFRNQNGSATHRSRARAPRSRSTSPVGSFGEVGRLLEAFRVAGDDPQRHAQAPWSGNLALVEHIADHVLHLGALLVAAVDEAEGRVARLRRRASPRRAAGPETSPTPAEAASPPRRETAS